MSVLTGAQALGQEVGVGTHKWMLSNSDFRILIMADNVLTHPWVQTQCKYVQDIFVVSGGKHYVTYYRKDGVISSPDERDQ
jgi:hypothetical protein